MQATCYHSFCSRHSLFARFRFTAHTVHTAAHATPCFLLFLYSCLGPTLPQLLFVFTKSPHAAAAALFSVPPWRCRRRIVCSCHAGSHATTGPCFVLFRHANYLLICLFSTKSLNELFKSCSCIIEKHALIIYTSVLASGSATVSSGEGYEFCTLSFSHVYCEPVHAHTARACFSVHRFTFIGSIHNVQEGHSQRPCS